MFRQDVHLGDWKAHHAEYSNMGCAKKSGKVEFGAHFRSKKPVAITYVHVRTECQCTGQAERDDLLDLLP